MLVAVEAFRAEQAAVLVPLRAAARDARSAQGRAGKALSAYAAALKVTRCGASTASFQRSIGELRSDVGTYYRLLDRASAARVRLEAAANAVTAAAAKSRVSAPVDLTATDKELAALRADARTRAAAIGSLQSRAAAAHARCLRRG